MSETRPLERSLARLNDELPWIRAEIGAPGEGWIVAADAGAGAAYARLQEIASAETGGADPRTVGAAVVGRYAYPAGLAALLYLRERRVFELAPAGVALHVPDGEEPTGVRLACPAFACLPDDPENGHPDARPVAGLDELRVLLARGIAAYLEPAIDPFYERTRLGRKALWGRGAGLALSAVAWDLAERGRAREGKAEAEAIAAASPLLGRAAPTFAVAPSRRGTMLVFTEGACCRTYRWLPARPKCDSCPLVAEDERIRLQRETWEAAEPAVVG